MKFNPKHNQCLFDIALQYTGSAETVFIILAANEGLELTDQLSPGQNIIVPEEAIRAGNPIVVEAYAKNNYSPARAVRVEEEQSSDGWLEDDEGRLEDDEGGIIG